MEEVTLRNIDESNFLECLKLKLAEGQEKYVSNPTRSLAQAYVYRRQCTPFGIYCGDVMVGYVLVLYDYDEEAYNIWHFMIDSDLQGLGFGKAAVGKVLEYISTKPFGKSGTVLLTVNPENTAADKLYRKFGFAPTGRSDGDEIELGLKLM
jgi:diamine N-acetyltransferase